MLSIHAIKRNMLQLVTTDFREKDCVGADLTVDSMIEATEANYAGASDGCPARNSSAAWALSGLEK